ncbi:hypothetical protein AVEN_198202-1 [Araneus ventricosus]|uniref:Uncharacterized protein n=1 Tax=Araneus ventricosus TaxID=182803 RepID=A0A4Y2E496_ARAVE|nr:hypothetical protein AVEN_198202-1 [Araneus ventricosus]
MQPINRACKVGKRVDHTVECELVALVQLSYINVRFEAALRLFWNGRHDFEPRSDDKDDTWSYFSKLPHHISATWLHLRCCKESFQLQQNAG